jgi:hypothetical protein
VLSDPEERRDLMLDRLPRGLLHVEALALLVGAIALYVHLGLDRLLGCGLKYPTGLEDTHLQRV